MATTTPRFDATNVAWLAEYLDENGLFGRFDTDDEKDVPYVFVGSINKEDVERAANLLGTAVYDDDGSFEAEISGDAAVLVMRAVYGFSAKNRRLIADVLEEPLELMGAIEASEALGVLQPNLRTLSGVPQPIAVLRCGSVWLASEIREYGESRGRRRRK